MMGKLGPRLGELAKTGTGTVRGGPLLHLVGELNLSVLSQPRGGPLADSPLLARVPRLPPACRQDAALGPPLPSALPLPWLLVETRALQSGN